MRYTVLTLTCNRLDALQRCLTKVRASASCQDYEVVVVNNGSQDGTRQYLDTVASEVRQRHGERPWIRPVHRPENEGVCARNYGIEIAEGEVIVQVDDDVLVTPGFDKVLLEPYANAKVGATGQHGFYQDSTWGLLIDDRRRPAVGQEADLLMGFCWSWRNIGYRYDWDFSPFWHEESDLQCQLRADGYRLMVTRPVAVHQTRHDWRETMADGPRTGTSIATRNFFRLKDKWHPPGIPFEGPRVGLHGPAPGGPARRPA